MRKHLAHLTKLAICGVLWAIPVAAQSVPDFDPSYIPSNLRMTAYPKCGVRSAADPVWPMTYVRKRDPDGDVIDSYLHKVGHEFWSKDGRIGSRYTQNPLLKVQVNCDDTTLRVKFFNAMVEDLYKISKKKRGERWGKLSRFDAPGIGPVSYSLGRRKSEGAETDVARVYFRHKGRIVSYMIQIGRTATRTNSGKRLRAGKVVELVETDGTVIRFRVTRNATQGPLGSVGFVRSEAENRALIEAIVKSIKPL